jgi:hypothetical protein
MQPSQSCDTVSQITLVDDVVAVEHRSRLVAGELHRYALRHPGAYEISDRGSANVVGDSAQEFGPYYLSDTTLLSVGSPVASGQPRTPEVADGCSMTVEHVRDGATRGSLQSLRSTTLLFQ